MLAINNVGIKEQDGLYRLPDGIELYAKTLHACETGRDNQVAEATGKDNGAAEATGKGTDGQPGSGRTAIYIHGGGSGGNHTIVSRPSRWLIGKGFFSTIIMPDRRGAAKSSPITSVMTYEDNARDMKQLLDSMGVHGKVTAIGVSYGGPIALTLAAIDERIDEVILVASSPALKPAKGLAGFLYRKGLLEKVVKGVYTKTVGKRVAAYPDFDGAYDAKGIGDLKKLFLAAIEQTDRSRLQSLLLENASTCDLKNAGIDPRFFIGVPVLRVIGTRDETWAVDLGERYRSQIPHLETRFIENAGHKDVFFRASEFYEALGEMLKEKSVQKGAPENIQESIMKDDTAAQPGPARQAVCA